MFLSPFPLPMLMVPPRVYPAPRRISVSVATVLRQGPDGTTRIEYADPEWYRLPDPSDTDPEQVAMRNAVLARLRAKRDA